MGVVALIWGEKEGFCPGPKVRTLGTIFEEAGWQDNGPGKKSTEMPNMFTVLEMMSLASVANCVEGV